MKQFPGVWPLVKYTAKAVGAALSASVWYLVGIWSESASFTEAWTTMSGVQWLGLAGAILTAWGVSYRAKNAPLHTG